MKLETIINDQIYSKMQNKSAKKINIMPKKKKNRDFPCLRTGEQIPTLARPNSSNGENANITVVSKGERIYSQDKYKG